MTEQEAINVLQSKYHLDCKIAEAIGELEAREVAVKVLEEIQEYRAIGGTPEMLVQIINFLGNDEDNSIIKDLELLNRYRVLGTVEELKEAKEKQIAKKPITYKGTNRADCPICGATVRGIDEPFGDWCSKCGVRLDWRNEDAE